MLVDLNTVLIIFGMGLTIGAVRTSVRRFYDARCRVHELSILELRYNLRALLRRMGEPYVTNGRLKMIHPETLEALDDPQDQLSQEQESRPPVA